MPRDLRNAPHMAGQPRGHLAAGTYHVTSRTAGPIPMFVDDDDRTYFCNLLQKVSRQYGCTVRMFCLMTTHVHLLVETHEDNSLQPFMKSLNWRYATRFNKRHARSGHLVGRRYWCARIRTAGHLLAAIRYIAKNPVAAGLCEHPEDWAWSSYRACVGLDESFAFVDATSLRYLFGQDTAEAALALRQFVTAA